MLPYSVVSGKSVVFVANKKKRPLSVFLSYTTKNDFAHEKDSRVLIVIKIVRNKFFARSFACLSKF